MSRLDLWILSTLDLDWCRLHLSLHRLRLFGRPSMPAPVLSDEALAIRQDAAWKEYLRDHGLGS
jgi:hypothetical protein